MPTENEKTLDALKTAIQMGNDGKDYYRRMSRTSSNALGSQLFKTLAAEEDTHRKSSRKYSTR